MSEDCIFCKIVAGDIPATKIYENNDVLAFMDINPWDKGHVLVIPKEHFDPITNVPADVLKEIMVVVKKVVAAQMKGLKATGVSIAQSNGKSAGQEVPHVHFHLIPRYSDGPAEINWRAGKYESFEQMTNLAQLITEAIV